MIKILIADDFELLREDLCETLGAQADMEVVGAAESGAGEAEAKKRLPLAAAVWLLRANEEEKEKLLPFLKNAAETA